MRNLPVYMLALIICALAGCSTPRSESLPEGPKGVSIVELTRSMKKDESPTVRSASALSLGRIGSRYPDLELIEAMKSEPSINVKMAAIRSLGQIGGERSLKSLNDYYLTYSNSAASEKAVLEELNNAIQKAGNGGAQ